jgi:hypothetical protein
MLALTPATLKLYATLSVIPTLLLSTLLSLTRDKKQGLDNEELLLFKQSREMKEWAKKQTLIPIFTEFAILAYRLRLITFWFEDNLVSQHRVITRAPL